MTTRRDFIRRGSLWTLGVLIVGPEILKPERRFWALGEMPLRYTVQQPYGISAVTLQELDALAKELFVEYWTVPRNPLTKFLPSVVVSESRLRGVRFGG